MALVKVISTTGFINEYVVQVGDIATLGFCTETRSFVYESDRCTKLNLPVNPGDVTEIYMNYIYNIDHGKLSLTLLDVTTDKTMKSLKHLIQMYKDTCCFNEGDWKFIQRH